jgi:hypothetical protein
VRFRLAICAYGILLATLPVQARAQDRCAVPTLKDLTGRAKATQAQLLLVKTADAMDETVTTATQLLIRSFKSELVAVADAYMICTAQKDSTPQSIHDGLGTMLGANQPEPASAGNVDENDFDKPQSGIFGSGLTISAARPAATPDTMVLTVDFGVACGEDTVLLAYSWQNGKWKRVIRWQSGDFENSLGAFGDNYRYAVLPGEGSHRWFVVVGHGSPWCSSRMSEYHLDVLSPSKLHGISAPIFHKDLGYSRFEDVDLRSVGRGFELRLPVDTIESDIMVRSGIFKYAFGGTTFTRVQPVAMNGRDFVDEWLKADWVDAKDWSEPGNLRALEAEHIDFARANDVSASNSTSFEYGPLAKCGESARRFQFELDRILYPGGQDGIPIYFQIEEGKNSFTMLSSSSTPDSKCKGGDPMVKH